jgi:hypothetical protein
MYCQYAVFAAMLRGQRTNTGVVTPSRGLFLTGREGECIQCYTIIYSVQYLHVGS